MAFGNSQQNNSSEKVTTYEARQLKFVAEEDKETSTGKTYWRVKDSNGKYYSVWEKNILEQLHAIQGAEGVVPSVVKKEQIGDKTYYSISAAGPDTEGIAKAGNEQAQASKAPGGRNSEWGKRMHPDDALRVTNLNQISATLAFIDLIIDDRPEGMSREQFAKGKFMPTMEFLRPFIHTSTTLTPDAPAPKTEESPATQFVASPDSFGTQTEEDADIPF